MLSGGMGMLGRRGRKERKSGDFTDSRDGGEDRNSSCGNNSSQYKKKNLNRLVKTLL